MAVRLLPTSGLDLSALRSDLSRWGFGRGHWDQGKIKLSRACESIHNRLEHGIRVVEHGQVLHTGRVRQGKAGQGVLDT
jgi:hypothetical protein